MFLDLIRRRNRALVEAAIDLHQCGAIPANTYVIDLDTVRENAQLLRQQADRLGLRIFAMTKQMGRNPGFCSAVREGGIEGAVAVDMACARAVTQAGLRISHIGHLVQVPRFEAREAAAMAPEYWTVFNQEKATEAAKAAGALGREQALLARIVAPGDQFYKGHEGGFDAADVLEVASRLDAIPHARFAGITTFPALLYDHSSGSVRPTPNLETLRLAAEVLAAAGRRDVQVNAPGTTSSVTMRQLADAGATQVEPGHGLTGTTPLHAVQDLPERPAVVYVSEVSHLHAGRAYCFGGGLYIDGVFPPYPVRAIVGRDADADALTVEIPPPEAIDYYGIIDVPSGKRVEVGDSVVFGFRPQIFVTRASVTGVTGISRGLPQAVGSL